jgi:photosystem II CP47 chlorophyll apoprotein
MLLYELLLFDPSDPVFDPAWRQGAFRLPFSARLGLTSITLSKSLGALGLFTLEDSFLSHALLAGLFFLAASWHWSFWDLDLFIFPSRVFQLHFGRIFGVHLGLAGLGCFSFGYFHLTGSFGPGFWTTDSFGSFGFVRPLQPSFELLSSSFLQYGVLAGHHILAGFVLLIAGIWHSTSFAGPKLFLGLKFGNIEGILSSSICPFFVAAFGSACLMWYGGSVTPADVFGPPRFSWDSSFYAQEILFRSSLFSWNGLTESFLLFDYIGVNPAKGGLFRAGPMIKGDGVLQNWIGHALFGQKGISLTVRRMPAFFETFPVVLVDQRGLVRAAIPFRRGPAARTFNFFALSFAGGILDGSVLQGASLVKNFARKSQLGELFTFERTSAALPDGVFRTSVRGWFSYSHAVLVLLFLLGHLWHAGRALFKDIWIGVRPDYGGMFEYGLNEKLF